MSSTITDPYPVVPFTVPANATVRVPGSKSITNRALAIGTILHGDRTDETIPELDVYNFLRSRDTDIMFSALRQLGIDAEVACDRRIDGNPEHKVEKIAVPLWLKTEELHYYPGNRLETVSKPLFKNKKATIQVGNAGTAARFLTAILCLEENGEFLVDGDVEMYKRPMKGLTDALATLGAEFIFHNTEGCIPFTVKTHGIMGSKVSVDASESSQILSALLIMAAGIGRPFEVELKGNTVSQPFVEMTLQMLAEFGSKITRKDNGCFIISGPDSVKSRSYRVEADATAASYFLSLPIAVCGSTAVDDLGRCTLQGDLAYNDTIKDIGIVCEKRKRTDLSGIERLDLAATLKTSQPHGVHANFNAFSDTFLTLAALTPLLDGHTRIEGLAHTRKQETDRVAAMATELRKLGQNVIEENDALEVHPDIDTLKRIALEARTASPSGCVEIDTYHDHRVAMSFAILGCRDLLGDGKPWLALRDPLCCKKTFPNFYEVLESARLQSLKAAFTTVAIDGGAATGKSSTSRGLAQKLGFMHVDTGSHYRALTLLFLNHKVGPTDAEGMAMLLKNSPLGTLVEKSENEAKITVDGQVPNDTDLRNDAVNAAVSKFAAVPAVRDALKEYQRGQLEIAIAHGYRGLVMEGRDIGSVIFPDADLKIFLEADEATRAKRREGQGQSDAVGERDKMDASRKTAPLVCPEGAVRLNNSHMTLAEVIDTIAGMATAL